MPFVRPGGKSNKKIAAPAVSSSQGRNPLKDLFVSQVRVDIFKLFLLNPNSQYHVRDITRRVDTEINAVRRELENLVKVGFLKRTPQKNRLYYSVKPDFVFLNEVLGFVVKDSAFGRAFSFGRSLGDIKLAFVSVPYLKGRVAGPNDIDLLVVGRVSLKKLAGLVKDEETRVGHEMNYTVLSDQEFEELKKRRDPLIVPAMLQPKIILTPGGGEYLAFE
jgi:hypothetical protein